MSGFIKIDRRLLEHTLWLSEPFTKGQAWVDIIARANFSDREKIFRGEMRQIKRGQLPTSDIELANRWKWSRNKVRTYLGMLEGAGMITTERTTKGTIITVENYSKYQDSGTAFDTNIETTDGTAEGHHKVQQKDIKRTSKGTTEGTHNKNIKKDKKEKNDKNVKNDNARTRAREEEDDESCKSSAPSFDEVEAYCRSIGLIIPRAFYRYCEDVIGWSDWNSVANEWQQGEIPPEALRI